MTNKKGNFLELPLLLNDANVIQIFDIIATLKC